MTPTTLDLLLLISSLLQRDQQRAFAGTTLTETRLHALWVLQHTGRATQQQLVVELGTTPRSVSALVDGLERTGYVRREPHPTDGRAVLVTLTGTARTMMTRMAEDHRDLTSRLHSAVAVQDRAALDRGLAAIAQWLEEAIAAESVEYRDVEHEAGAEG